MVERYKPGDPEPNFGILVPPLFCLMVAVIVFVAVLVWP